MGYSQDLSRICHEHSKLMAEGKVPYGHKNMIQRVTDWYFALDMGAWEPYVTKERFDEMRHKEGSTYENVVKVSITRFYNFTDMPEKAVYAWKESMGHDANMLGPKSTVAGFGIYCKPVKDSKFYAYECWNTGLYKGIDAEQLTDDGWIKYPNGTTSKDGG